MRVFGITCNFRSVRGATAAGCRAVRPSIDEEALIGWDSQLPKRHDPSVDSHQPPSGSLRRPRSGLLGALLSSTSSSWLGNRQLNSPLADFLGSLPGPPKGRDSAVSLRRARPRGAPR